MSAEILAPVFDLAQGEQMAGIECCRSLWPQLKPTFHGVPIGHQAPIHLPSSM
jgi:hypothetical protein